MSNVYYIDAYQLKLKISNERVRFCTMIFFPDENFMKHCLEHTLNKGKYYNIDTFVSVWQFIEGVFWYIYASWLHFTIKKERSPIQGDLTTSNIVSNFVRFERAIFDISYGKPGRN